MSDLFIEDLCCKNDETSVIAETEEMYIPFSKIVHVDEMVNYIDKTKKFISNCDYYMHFGKTIV